MSTTHDPDIMRARLGLLPTAKRRHFVFVAACGCPFGLTEERLHQARSKGVTTEGEAWEDMYDTRAQERAARDRGVRVVHVDHATYEREFYPLMTRPCPHRD
jgi:hypothetical protein